MSEIFPSKEIPTGYLVDDILIERSTAVLFEIAYVDGDIYTLTAVKIDGRVIVRPPRPEVYRISFDDLINEFDLYLRMNHNSSYNPN